VNCEATDWVELVNISDVEADISGWLLTDDPLDRNPLRDSHRFLFPAGTTIAPNDDLVVQRDEDGADPVEGFPFGISCGDDTLRLADAGGTLVPPQIVIPDLIVPGDTWGRYPNAIGDFAQTAPTMGAPNQPSSGGGPGGDQAAWMFEPDVVVEIDLELPQESIDALAVEPKEYADGTFSLTTTGGTYGPLAVGVRLKGGLGSFRPLTGKAAFKIKFNHSVGGQRFLGLEKLTLNNMVQDASMVHEVLAYESFRAMGIPASRAGYAYVRVNDSDYGLYLNLETVDEVSLPRWFASTQHLLEGELGADAVTGAPEFEVDEGSESNLADLETLIAAQDEATGDWSERIAAVADLERMIRMWAVERYIGHWDGYAGSPHGLHPNNYYLHSDAAGVFTMLPSGTDQTWGMRLHFRPDVGGAMARSCFTDESCYADFRAAVHTARSTIAGLDLDSLAASTAATLAPWQAMDPRRPYSPEQIAAAVTATRGFIAARPGDVDDPALWPDVASPESTIASGPRPVIRTRRRRAEVKFALGSSEPGSSFECRLDHGRWTACGSTLILVVGRGHHILLARAIDAAGNADPSPARHSWRVRRPRPARAGLRAVG
jgi:hypothetical protein